MNFYEFYSLKLNSFNNRKFDLGVRKANVAKEIVLTRKSLAAMGKKEDSHDQIVIKKEVAVLLKVNQIGDLKLRLTYIVKNASWIASYDVRVALDNSIQLTYHGTIKQNTHESWENVNLALSTANPSIGGSPPDILPVNLRFIEYRYDEDEYDDDMMALKDMNSAKLRKAYDMKGEEKKKDKSSPRSRRVEVQTAKVVKVSDSATSAIFKIPRITTIESDDKGHKVTITIVQFKEATFKYTIMPKLNQNAYLQATVKNTSDFTLLAGSVSVFFGNTFATSSSIKAASPNEEFDLELGVDPGITVVYKAPHKYVEHSGIISKTDVQILNYQTEIKNTKSTEIRFVLWEQLPLSTIETIKVKLLQPDLRATRDVTQDKNNNLKWVSKIAPGNVRTIPFSYSIEYPKNKEIEIYDSN